MSTVTNSPSSTATGTYPEFICTTPGHGRPASALSTAKSTAATTIDAKTETLDHLRGQDVVRKLAIAFAAEVIAGANKEWAEAALAALDAGWTQRELAADLGIAQSTLNHRLAHAGSEEQGR